MSDIKKVSLNINNEKCIQEHFHGAGAVYHAYTFRADFPERQYGEAEQSIELERVKNMELKVVRTFFDLVAYKDGSWDWECDEMQALYKWLAKMQELDVEVALNAAWWISGHIFSNEESPLYDKNPKIAARKYGDWVSEVVHQLIELRGFTNIKYLVILTEPNDGCWKFTCEGGELANFRAYELCARAADRQLRADRRRHLVKFIGPNTGMMDDGDPSMLQWAVEHVDDSIDIYSTHKYFDYFENTNIVRETYNGTGSLRFGTPGFRAQQFVNLEPDTEYELSLYAKAADDSNIKEWQRGFLFGAFETTEGENRLISAGLEGISYLTENSVVLIPASDITTQWQQFKMCFNTGDKNYAHIGIYHDVSPFDEVMFYDCVSLHKAGDTKELLANGDFEDRDSTAWLAFKGGIGYTDDKLPLYTNVKALLRRYLKCVPKGKEFWFDEYNSRYVDTYTDGRQGTSLAVIQSAMLNSGVNCNLLWTVFDQLWPFCRWDGFDSFVDGDHRCGTMPNLKRSKVPYPAYYAFTLISKYLGDHDSRIYEGDVADSVCASCVQGSDGHYCIMLANFDSEEKEVKINISKELNRTLHRHLYDPAVIIPDEKAEIIGVDKKFEDVKGELVDKLPANAVVIYTTRAD